MAMPTAPKSSLQVNTSQRWRASGKRRLPILPVPQKHQPGTSLPEFYQPKHKHNYQPKIINRMKKLLNYSLLMFLFSFIAFACSKEDGDVGPSASLTKASTNGALTPVGNYDVGCINDEGGNEWSFAVNGPGNVQGEGLSHLNLKLYDCEGNEIDLSTCYVTDARIVIEGGATYTLNNGFTIEYNDGDCGGNNLIKFDDVTFGDVLKASNSRFYFTLSCDEIIASASVVIKVGVAAGGCSSPATIYNCDPDACDDDEESVCSLSQGYWFASPVSAGWGTVTVGSLVRNESTLRTLFTSSNLTVQQKAFFQAAALILTAGELGLTIEAYLALIDAENENNSVSAAYYCIVSYFNANDPILLTKSLTKAQSKSLQDCLGTIGDWIESAPECEVE
jgi:hypothetical protein